MRKSLVLSVLLCCLGAAEAFAAEPTRIELDIPAQPVRAALKQLSDQSGVQVLMRVDNISVEGVTSPRVSGSLTVQEAIERLLVNSGLTYEFVDANTVRITAPAARDSAQMSGREAITLAQAAKARPDPAREVDAAGTEGRAQVILDEIVVTGSHIRGGEQAPGTKLLVIGRQEIDRSGYATVQDFMKSLPQNFGGGITEDSTSDPTALNLNGGTAINLRGLGADSTLVLVNGRRQAAGGLNGSFVDVSSIPTSAIERIEILPDGASAIYGSDAVGGVVNFVLRRDFSGAETGIRVGTLGGDADETRVSQLLGTSWSRGHALIGYQYYERGALDRVDREYTRSSDYRRYGGSDFRRFQSSPGNILGFDGRPAYAIPPGQNGTALAPSDLQAGVVNYQPETGNLLARQKSHGAFFSTAFELTPSLELFADGRFGRRETRSSSGGFAMTLPVPATNPYFVDPFGGSFSVNVAYNFLDDLGPIEFDTTTRTYAGAVGAVYSLTDQWSLTATATYAQEKAEFHNQNTLDFASLFGALFSSDPATAFNAFGSGAHNNSSVIEAIRASQRNEGEGSNYGASLVASGPLFEMAGGQATVALGADLRKESITSLAFLKQLRAGASSLDRRVTAGFAELSLPLIGATNARPGVEALALSLAGRIEDYDDFGSTSNPHLGLKWTMLDSLSFRGGWGTSFKAPRLIDLDDSRTANSSSGNLAFITPIEDPQAAGWFSNALIAFGGNRVLKPERSTNWTAGLDFSPESWQGAGVSVTYYNIRYRDRIAAGGPTGNPYGVLLQENVWRDVITRNPTQAQLAVFCDRPEFGLDCSVPPAVIADLRLRNLSRLTTDGVDVDLHGSRATAVGELGARLNASYVLSFDQRVTNTAPDLQLVDTVGNPLKFRVRSTFSWTRAALSSNLMVNYAGSYRDTVSVPQRNVSSWTTVDLSLGYGRERGPNWNDGLRVTANAVNVFDRKPPFVNVQYAGYDTANADLIGRVLSVDVAKTW